MYSVLHPLITLLQVLLWVFNIMLIARILLSWWPIVQPWHPAARLLRRVVDPVLLPLRRMLPAMGGIDFSPLLLAVLISLLSDFLGSIDAALFLSSFASATFDPGRVVLIIVGRLLHQIALILCIVVLLRVIVISLFQASPFHPFTLFVRQLSNPFVEPFMRSARGVHPEAGAVIALVAYVAGYFLIGWFFLHVTHVLI
jgi:YggT family protein